MVGTDRWAVLDKPAGSTARLIAGIGTIAAGGISWVPSGPDSTRSLPRTASGRAVVGSTVDGAGIVVLRSFISFLTLLAVAFSAWIGVSGATCCAGAPMTPRR